MGDTTLAGTGGGAHAVEGGITHGPANAIHCRLSARRASDHRAVRTLRRLAQDRLQVDRALPAPWAGGPGKNARVGRADRPPWSIPIASKSATSVPTVAFDGTAAG